VRTRSLFAVVIIIAYVLVGTNWNEKIRTPKQKPKQQDRNKDTAWARMETSTVKQHALSCDFTGAPIYHYFFLGVSRSGPRMSESLRIKRVFFDFLGSSSLLTVGKLRRVRRLVDLPQFVDR
jgi:hypothetical protein